MARYRTLRGLGDRLGRTFCGPQAPDSAVLRPVNSVDGMTAQSVAMETSLIETMSQALLAVEGICGVFCDLPRKPPATIEWE